MLRTDDLEYELPERLIATQPLAERDQARLLVVSRSDSNRLEHRQVCDLPELLAANDLLVFNDTRVVPARFEGRRLDTGGRIEGLFLAEAAPADAGSGPGAGGRGPQWSVLLKSNGKLRAGTELALVASVEGEPQEEPAIRLRLLEKHDDAWRVQVLSHAATHDLLNVIGRTPLPPYILRSRRHRGEDETPDGADRDHYQTVYARDPGAVAAPTAGLHFTPALLSRLDAAGIQRAFVTLHVGAGTFKPVESAFLEDHPMHREWYSVPTTTLNRLRACNLTRSQGSSLPGAGRGAAAAVHPRVIAIGTTSVRTLESLPTPLPEHEVAGEADLLIAPGYEFRYVDGLLTNFHLPRSTLIALVAALLGLERTMSLYRTAVSESYRFYSYGDAMLILP